MMEWLTAALLLAGVALGLVAAFGLLRLPDLYMRMHAAAKAGTLGLILILLAVIVHFADGGVSIRALLVIAFLFLTAPVAAQLIAHAAWSTDVPFWGRTVQEESDGAGGGPAGGPP